MNVDDPIFGELEYSHVWSKDTTINFGGKENKIALMIKGDEDSEFHEEQYIAYKSLMEKWEELQQYILKSILKYYKEKRHELGYDVKYNKNYPLIETTDKLLENIILVGIIVPYAGSFDGRDMGIIFDCT